MAYENYNTWCHAWPGCTYIEGTEGKRNSSSSRISVYGTSQTVAPAQPALTVNMSSWRAIGLFGDECMARRAPRVARSFPIVQYIYWGCGIASYPGFPSKNLPHSFGDKSGKKAREKFCTQLSTTMMSHLEDLEVFIICGILSA